MIKQTRDAIVRVGAMDEDKKSKMIGMDSDGNQCGSYAILTCPSLPIKESS